MNEQKLQKLKEELRSRIAAKRRAQARCSVCNAPANPLQLATPDRGRCEGCITLAQRLWPEEEVQIIPFGPLSDKQADEDGGYAG